MDITAFAYGVDIPMISAIYNSLLYSTGPLALPLCILMFIGFASVIYLLAFKLPKYLRKLRDNYAIMGNS